MKVFLDTNVRASAAATRGLCAAGQDLIDDFIWLLQQDSVLAQPGQLPKVKLQDKDDLLILGAAIASGAEVLITGDKELLELGDIEGLEILSPRQFWEKLKAQQQRQTGRGKPRRPG